MKQRDPRLWPTATCRRADRHTTSARSGRFVTRLDLAKYTRGSTPKPAEKTASGNYLGVLGGDAAARRPSQALARTKTAMGSIMPPPASAALQLGGDPTTQPQAALQGMTGRTPAMITPGTFTTPAPQAPGAGGPGASVVPGQGNSPASNPINHYGALSCSGEVIRAAVTQRR